MTVYKHILQIALGDSYKAKLPLDTIKDNLLLLNPGYSYTLLDDYTSLDFLDTYFPEYIQIFFLLHYPHHKSDLIRALYLYKFGGFYVDVDLLPIVSFDTILEHIQHPTAYFMRGAVPNSNGIYNNIANGFLYSEPNNQFLLHIANFIIKNPNPEGFGTYVEELMNVLESKYGAIVPYTSYDGTYILAETRGKHDSPTTERKFYIYADPSYCIGFSNGHGYPYKMPIA